MTYPRTGPSGGLLLPQQRRVISRPAFVPNVVGPVSVKNPFALSGFWDGFTDAGQAIGGSVLDAVGTEADKALFDLKATLGTTAILSFIAAATGTYLAIRTLRR